jgi:hypothetical protein
MYAQISMAPEANPYSAPRAVRLNPYTDPEVAYFRANKQNARATMSPIAIPSKKANGAAVPTIAAIATGTTIAAAVGA